MRMGKFNRGDYDRIMRACGLLREVRNLLRDANAPKATGKVRAALKSTEGALRHCMRREVHAEKSPRHPRAPHRIKISKKQLRQRLLDAHRDAGPTWGDYHGYAESIELDYDSLLHDLGLSHLFEINAARGEGDYIDALEVRAKASVVTIPDVSDWAEGSVDKPTCIDECVEWWWNFATSKVPK